MLKKNMGCFSPWASAHFGGTEGEQGLGETFLFYIYLQICVHIFVIAYIQIKFKLG